MSTTTVPANMDDAMKMLESALGMQECVLGFLAAQDAADLPAGAAADQLRALERTDAIRAPSGAGCWRSSTPRTGTWPTGSGPPGPGWSIRRG